MKYFIKSRVLFAQDIVSKLPKKTSDRLKRFLSDPENYQTLGLWVASVVAALVAVLYAKLFHFAENSFQQILNSSSWYLIVLSPVFFLFAWYLVYRYAPEAAGSGIPQIVAANEMEYSNGKVIKVDRLLSLKTALVKIASSLLCVFGGGAIGREGPTLQISTSVFHFFGKQIRRISPRVDEHVLVVAGAAAGLASAFNTPLGGIVYAIEELGLVHFHKVRTALISGVIVSGLVAQGVLGSYLFLGLPKITVIDFSFLPTVVFNGVICGVLGAFFGRMLLYVFFDAKFCGRKIGCPLPTTGNIARPLDIIEFFAKRSTRIIDIVGPLYEKGLSITDIAEQTGVKRYTIWKTLKNHKKILRSQDPVPFERWRQGRGKMKARPPFGFCYFQGEVVKDPKEYPTVLLIQSLWKQGTSISSIVRHLDGKGIQTRTGKSWSYNVIKATIQRLESKQYEKLSNSNKVSGVKNKTYGGKK